jgi:crossover junction endodeoxyribonuclease RuvC
MKTIIGVDPGKHGALVAMKENGDMTTLVMPLAGEDLDLVYISDWCRQFIKDIKCAPLSVCIEKVHAMPGQGTVSMFTFGYGVGCLHGVFATLKIPRYLVAPQTWKKLILADTAKDKDAAIEYVKRVYPNLVITATERSKRPHSGIADAVCIARYGILKI